MILNNTDELLLCQWKYDKYETLTTGCTFSTTQILCAAADGQCVYVCSYVCTLGGRGAKTLFLDLHVVPTGLLFHTYASVSGKTCLRF